MKEAIFQTDLSVQIVDSPAPTLNAEQDVNQSCCERVQPKGLVGATAAHKTSRLTIFPKKKKKKETAVTIKAANTGDDIAGVVHAVGGNVHEFKPRDRVMAFHEVGTHLAAPPSRRRLRFPWLP
jgi:NADPH:quinone reductase